MGEREIVMSLLGFLGFGNGSSGQESAQAREWVSQGATLLDVRTPEEFSSGHLDGALNIPVQELASRLGELPRTPKNIVVYCRSGGRSSSAAALLRQRGYEVFDLGPMSNW